MIAGKSATTSVPSIAIRFHANAEELEELYCSDQEHGDAEQNISLSGSGKRQISLGSFVKLNFNRERRI